MTPSPKEIREKVTEHLTLTCRRIGMKAKEWKDGFSQRPKWRIPIAGDDKDQVFAQVADNGTCEFLPIAFEHVRRHPAQQQGTSDKIGLGRLIPQHAVELGQWLIDTFKE